MLSQRLNSPLLPGRRTERGTPDSSGLNLTLGAFILEGSSISGRGEGIQQDAEAEENLFPSLTK